MKTSEKVVNNDTPVCWHCHVNMEIVHYSFIESKFKCPHCGQVVSDQAIHLGITTDGK